MIQPVDRRFELDAEEAAVLAGICLKQAQDKAEGRMRWYSIESMIGSIKRNAACPCGSQKKYKKCCIDK